VKSLLKEESDLPDQSGQIKERQVDVQERRCWGKLQNWLAELGKFEY
jgi:hypothetical protein